MNYEEATSFRDLLNDAINELEKHGSNDSD